MVYEDYKEQYTGHIDGTARNEREAHESADEEAEANAKKSVAKSQSKGRASQMNKTSSKFDDDGTVSQAALSKRSSRRSVGAKSERDKSLSKTADQFRFELPPACMLTFVKKLLIDKLPAKYFLSAHPFPKIEGEMFIIKPQKKDQSSKDSIIYRDYSLRKRIETTGRVSRAD